jgi:hypothetical protein
VPRRPETAESAKLGEEYLFRTQQQVHEKIYRQTAPTDAWGGMLVGVRKPPDPKRYFCLVSVSLAL